MKLAGAVASDVRRAHALATGMARLLSAEHGLSVTTVHDAGGVTLCFAQRADADGGGSIASGGSNESGRYWIAGESIRQDRPAVGHGADSLQRAADAVEGGFVGVELIPTGVRLRVDSWGLGWIYVRVLDDAVVFSSDFRAVCAAGPGLVVDPDALLLELGVGYVPDDGTIFNDITLLPPGSVADVDARSVSVREVPPAVYGDALKHAPERQKLESLDALYETMSTRMSTLAHGPVAISLSAGLDSRYALAWLDRKRAVGRLLTFGEGESDEVTHARAFAGIAGGNVPWDHFTVGGTSFERWRSMIQSLGNAGIVQWCGWADEWLSFVRERTGSCLIGFLGDAFSGKRLDILPNYDPLAEKLDRSVDLWARRWAALELDNANWVHSPVLRPDARARLLASTAARFDKLLSTARIAQPHQAAQHCNFRGRQRRWVAAQPALLANHVRPLLFFVDRAFRTFWTNVGFEDLHGQALYLRYGEDRFPRFFPRRPSPVARFASRVVNRAKREIAQMLAPPPPRRPPPVPHMKLLAPHLPAIRDLLDRTSPTLEAFLDTDAMRSGIDAIERGTPSPNLSTAMLIRAVNVMHLLELRQQAPLR